MSTYPRYEEAFGFAWGALRSIAEDENASDETQLQAQRALDHLRTMYPAASEGLDAPKRINGKCSWCGEPMEIPERPQGGGRTKLYCSESHRVAAHRAAKK